MHKNYSVLMNAMCDVEIIESAKSPLQPRKAIPEIL